MSTPETDHMAAYPTLDAEDCHRCGGPNVIWSAASPLWNLVMRGNDINGEPRHGDLVCMPCFILCAVEAGLPAHGWRLTLTPEPEGLIYVTPSGRRWDERRFHWIDPQPAAEADCECGHPGDDHIFTSVGECGQCDCARYAEVVTRPEGER